LRLYEKLLLEFRFSDALDAAMSQSKSNPIVVVSMFQELIRRHALHVALAGRSDAQLRRIVHFVCRHVTDARLSRPLLDTSMALTELYTSRVAVTSSLASAFKRLSALVTNEIDRLEQLGSLQGQIDLLVSNMTS
jgi:U3 small nucleolar RNA-associated protein 15